MLKMHIVTAVVMLLKAMTSYQTTDLFYAYQPFQRTQTSGYRDTDLKKIT